MSNVSVTKDQPLVEQFKAFYRELTPLRLDDMSNLYRDDIVFRDPVHEVRGIHYLHAYMLGVCSSLSRCHFDYLDQLLGDGRAYIKWDMTFNHPRLGCAPITVRGISQIAFHEKIYYHEDVYDMGQLLYEHLPLMGGATRWLKRRLGKSVR